MVKTQSKKAFLKWFTWSLTLKQRTKITGLHSSVNWASAQSNRTTTSALCLQFVLLWKEKSHTSVTHSCLLYEQVKSLYCGIQYKQGQKHHKKTLQLQKYQVVYTKSKLNLYWWTCLSVKERKSLSVKFEKLFPTKQQQSLLSCKGKKVRLLKKTFKLKV